VEPPLLTPQFDYHPLCPTITMATILEEELLRERL
jgi:hypothetical protein